MSYEQSNTLPGPFPVNSAEDLSAKNGYLVELVDGGSIAEVQLPTAVTDLALYIVDDGAVADEFSTVAPLSPHRQVRIKAKGTGSAGATLVLADPGTAADKGKVRTVPATAGLYFSPGLAEEDFVDGQLVLVRPMPRIVTVAGDATAISGAADLAALKTALGTILTAAGIIA